MTIVLRPGDQNDLVRVLQARLNRDYPQYPNLVVDGDYGPATTHEVKEFQRRAGLVDDGTAGPETLGRLGLIFEQPSPLLDHPFYYCVAGTWGTPFQGPPFDVGLRLERMAIVRNQPVGYPAVGFLNPDPFTSYNESVALGVAELVRLILMNPGRFLVCGYSQGAEVVVRTLRLMLPGQPLAHRVNDLLMAITFGSPCRAPGPTLLGNNPIGSGISRIYTPEQFRTRTYDFVIDGDMYATTTDQTLLPLAYKIGTAAELDLVFAAKLMALIQSDQILDFLSLPNTPENVAKAVNTGIVVGDFLNRNPHIHYHDWLSFNGSTGVDRAIQIVAASLQGSASESAEPTYEAAAGADDKRPGTSSQ